MTSPPEYHSVVVLGGGPGGLGVAALLAGWRPTLKSGALPEGLPSWLARHLVEKADDLLGVDFAAIAGEGINPGDLFRLLHHPSANSPTANGSALGFSRQEGVDFLLLSNESPGGLWNNVPRNQLTLSPAHWMEMAPLPMRQFAAETGRGVDPGALILKDDLVAYYHAVPRRLGLEDRIRTGVQVCAALPGDDRPDGDARGRFRIEAQALDSGRALRFACDFLVFATGPRSCLRRLGVPGEDLPFVSHHYDHWDDYPGRSVVVIGGGRSADWAATELHDAGRRVVYVMRQAQELQDRLINESQHLPYYARLRAIVDSDSERLRRVFGSTVVALEAPGRAVIDGPGGRETLAVDHAVIEIGGEPDYGLLRAFGNLTLVAKRDNYRFQLNQMAVTPHTGESVDIPGLYPAGYLVLGTGLSVIGFHGAAYPAAADIIRKIQPG